MKIPQYVVTVVNTKTGECYAFLTDYDERVVEEEMMAECNGNIVFVNEIMTAAE